MLFKPGTPLYSYEVQREAGGQAVYVNYLGASFVPNLADNPDIMNRTFDLLIESPDVSRIVFVQQRNYNYSSSQIFMLQEIANLYIFLTKQEKVLSPVKLSISNTEYLSHRYNDVAYLLITLKRDPLACYFELERFIGEEKANMSSTPPELKFDKVSYIRVLERFYSLLGNTRLIIESEKYFGEYRFGSRNIYFHFFRPDIIPNFTFTRLAASLPEDAEIVHQYEIGEEEDISVVTILKKEEDTKYFYHLMPPEYSLDENKQNLLNLARNVLIEHQPKAEEFTDPEKTRQVFFNVSRDLLSELSENKGVKLTYNELNKLARILVRHTIGFGLIEVLLYDTNLQDIVLNAPISANPVYLRHGQYDECSTNIIPSREDADSWAAKFRMTSGRPLDEANPILDTDLSLGKIRARISVIQQPLSPNGLAYAIRRHREDPWTLSLFIKDKMLNSFSAGLLSFLIDGSRTMLIAGTRSSGKTSLLGSLMLEIMPKYRVIVIEDTLELPVDALRKLKYDILRMKVRSSLLKTTTEIGADEGIRTSLRLGDSCLIVGEVRSLEAQALYEAMRVGALANVVAGTIHGASPYGVFDRVVNDLQVPVTSFKATDCIVVANPVKTPDGMKSMKRVIQLTEVRKHWNKDPEEEGGFVDLLKYNVEKDNLEASEELINGDSEVIKSIASGVKGWAGNWDAVYDNIELRGRIKQEIVDVSEKLKMPEILESKFNALSNNMFHQFSQKIREEVGLPTSDRVFPVWQEWLKTEVKKFRV
ncbi:MAG: type II/IV secretion system ATPase subunit [Candidatus Nanoarchaeia archaeon]|nr:type II/IV secretion system ATPase subunit [Candidatus Nanoarchaeia archaeon]MDD5741148.1 type II/IV secretion system ATPase subunit [Candidatus Nanoarchaeia archaeon]